MSASHPGRAVEAAEIDAALGARAGGTRQPATLNAKAWATLQARAALLEVALVRGTDDRDREVFYVSRWTRTLRVESVDEVEQFLRRLGGPNA